MGIEPTNVGTTIRCVNHFATTAKIYILIVGNLLGKRWRSGRDSNPRPPAWQAGILTNWTTGPNCGDRIWTCDLRVMSPTSYRTAPPRDNKSYKVLHMLKVYKDCINLSKHIQAATRLIQLAVYSLKQLSLLHPATIKVLNIWWRMTGSNRRPSACKADALPAELSLHIPHKVTCMLRSIFRVLCGGPDNFNDV